MAPKTTSAPARFGPAMSIKTDRVRDGHIPHIVHRGGLQVDRRLCVQSLRSYLSKPTRDSSLIDVDPKSFSKN